MFRRMHLVFPTGGGAACLPDQEKEPGTETCTDSYMYSYRALCTLYSDWIHDPENPEKWEPDGSMARFAYRFVRQR